MNVFSRSQLLVKLCFAFSERSKVSSGVLLEFRSRGIIVVLLGRRHLFIILGIWMGFGFFDKEFFCYLVMELDSIGGGGVFLYTRALYIGGGAL